MNKALILLLFVIFQNVGLSQNIFLCYEPIKQDMNIDKWSDIDAHLDTMYSKFSDSIIVPFTLFQIGSKLYEKQDLIGLYKYSKKMLEYNHKELNTKLPEISKTKWDWYCTFLPTKKIYYYGHFYLASSYLYQQQYDSCLLHLDSAIIVRYVSAPRNDTYDLSVGLHKTMMRSLCFEGKGNIEEARRILIPYLFLDKLPEVENYFTHLDLIERYFILLKKSNKEDLVSLDANYFFQIKEINQPSKNGVSRITFTETNDSIVNPSGWYSNRSNPSGDFVLVEDIYVPVYYNSYEYFTAHEKHESFILESYLEETEFFKRVRN